MANFLRAVLFVLRTVALCSYWVVPGPYYKTGYALPGSGKQKSRHSMSLGVSRNLGMNNVIKMISKSKTTHNELTKRMDNPNKPVTTPILETTTKIKKTEKTDEVAHGRNITLPATDVLCKYCDIYNTRAKAREDFECVVHNLIQPPTHIRIYNITVDKYISGHILKKGGWEKKEIGAVLKWVDDDPSMGFIDIGANIGMYTLTLANTGHQVISVEPGIRHLMRMHRSMELGDLHDRITLFRNGVGDVRGVAKMLYFGGNNRAISSIEMLNKRNLQAASNRTNPDLYLHDESGSKFVSKKNKNVNVTEE